MTALKLQDARDADAGLILTPMIDVVFQLLVFFLLSLRFKTVDERIQSELPLHRGTQVSNDWLDPETAVRVRLAREPGPDAARSPTRVRLGRAIRLDLPPADGPARERALDQLALVLRQARFAIGTSPTVRGEILTPWPGGALVPHGDVVAVLDACLEAGLVDVAFQGAALPAVH